MTSRWHIRPYRNGDEKQILQLRQTVFGDLDPVRLKEAVWKWQFEENPAGKAFCLLAEAEGRVVGQYVTIPTRLSILGTKIVAAFSCDTMIHPLYRRQGMFSTLARELYRYLEEKVGIHLVWGFPNNKSLPGFTHRLGWKAFPPIPLMVVPLRPLSVLLRLLPTFRKRILDPSLPQAKDLWQSPETEVYGLNITPVSHFNEAFDDLWKEHSSAQAVMQIRDRRYLQWRYLSVPEFHYRPFAVLRKQRLLGYIVMRMLSLKGQRFGVLVDMFPFPLESSALTLNIFSFAKRYVKSLGGDFLTCLLPRSQSGILKKAGFLTAPEVINPRTWWLGYRSAKTGHFEASANWHITYGDTDVV